MHPVCAHEINSLNEGFSEDIKMTSMARRASQPANEKLGRTNMGFKPACCIGGNRFLQAIGIIGPCDAVSGYFLVVWAVPRPEERNALSRTRALRSGLLRQPADRSGAPPYMAGLGPSRLRAAGPPHRYRGFLCRPSNYILPGDMTSQIFVPNLKIWEIIERRGLMVRVN